MLTPNREGLQFIRLNVYDPKDFSFDFIGVRNLECCKVIHLSLTKGKGQIWPDDSLCFYSQKLDKIHIEFFRFYETIKVWYGIFRRVDSIWFLFFVYLKIHSVLNNPLGLFGCQYTINCCKQAFLWFFLSFERFG